MVNVGKYSIHGSLWDYNWKSLTHTHTHTPVLDPRRIGHILPSRLSNLSFPRQASLVLVESHEPHPWELYLAHPILKPSNFPTSPWLFKKFGCSPVPRLQNDQLFRSEKSKSRDVFFLVDHGGFPRFFMFGLVIMIHLGNTSYDYALDQATKVIMKFNPSFYDHLQNEFLIPPSCLNFICPKRNSTTGPQTDCSTITDPSNTPKHHEQCRSTWPCGMVEIGIDSIGKWNFKRDVCFSLGFTGFKKNTLW